MAIGTFPPCSKLLTDTRACHSISLYRIINPDTRYKSDTGMLLQCAEPQNMPYMDSEGV